MCFASFFAICAVKKVPEWRSEVARFRWLYVHKPLASRRDCVPFLSYFCIEPMQVNCC